MNSKYLWFVSRQGASRDTGTDVIVEELIGGDSHRNFRSRLPGPQFVDLVRVRHPVLKMYLEVRRPPPDQGSRSW